MSVKLGASHKFSFYEEKGKREKNIPVENIYMYV